MSENKTKKKYSKWDVFLNVWLAVLTALVLLVISVTLDGKRKHECFINNKAELAYALKDCVTCNDGSIVFANGDYALYDDGFLYEKLCITQAKDDRIKALYDYLDLKFIEEESSQVVKPAHVAKRTDDDKPSAWSDIVISSVGYNSDGSFEEYYIPSTYFDLFPEHNNE